MSLLQVGLRETVTVTRNLEIESIILGFSLMAFINFVS